MDGLKAGEAFEKIISRRFPEYALIPHGGGAVILAIVPYAPFADPGAEYLILDAYYPVSNRAFHAAGELCAELTAAGFPAERYRGRDLKSLALASGLADTRGRNTLAYNEKYGSRFVLAAVSVKTDCRKGSEVTNKLSVDGLSTDETFKNGLPTNGLSPDKIRMGAYEHKTEKPCTDCGACAAACPQGAITAEGFRADKCLRTHMTGGTYPDDASARAAGRRLLGCDICQRVCPLNGAEGAPVPEELLRALKIETFLVCGRGDIAALGEIIGYNYAEYNRLTALAVIAAANTGEARYLPLILRHADSKSETLATAVQQALRLLNNKITK